MNIHTLLIHGAEKTNANGAINDPVYFTSTFQSPSTSEILRRGLEPMNDFFYTRHGNPTISQTASLIAKLESAEAALLTASGVSAIATTLLSLLKKGDHIIAQHVHYGAAKALIRDTLPNFGVEVTFVDQTNNNAFAKAIQTNTRVIYCESPSNPILNITDLNYISKLAKQNDIVTVIDNTLASPYNSKPIIQGIDVVIHSATKYLSGHSDLVAGVVSSSRKIIEQIWDKLIVLGGIASPFESWLILRGLKTFGLRMERHNATAMKIAKFLESHTSIQKVYYPGLESHPQHILTKTQMSGFGGVLSFELDDPKKCDSFLKKLKLPKLAPSLGGVESLVVQPVAMLAHSISAEEYDSAGVSPHLIRLAVGLEEADDLIDDIQQALD